MHRSGFVALAGRPNVGKSTLLNALVGEKVAIVTAKPQTTRNRLRAVLTREDAQIIFVDTPGVHKPKHRLGSYMVEEARGAFREVDLICLVVEAHRAPGPGDRYIASLLSASKVPVLLVLNKADLAAPDRLRRNTDLYRQLLPFKQIHAVSALKGEGMEKLVQEIIGLLPEGPQYYPPDMVTDQPEKFIIAELVREKIIDLTREEIPFSVAVAVEQMSPRPDSDIVDLRVEIYVERESQVGIIVGKEGSLLKEVGSRARREVEALLGCRIYLELWVKVKKDWRNRPADLRAFGYEQ